MKSNNEYALERDIEVMRTQLAEAREESATAGRNAKHYADKCIELEATVERMMAAFKRIMTTDENGNSMRWHEIDEMVRPLLTSTPAANVAWVKAQAYRDAADFASGPAVTMPLPYYTPAAPYIVYGDQCRMAVAKGLRAAAERLEKAHYLLNPASQAEQNKPFEPTAETP